MNRIYSVVFNRTLGIWQCVSELVRRGKKVKSCRSVGSSNLLKPTSLTLFCFSLLSSVSAQTAENYIENPTELPKDGKVIFNDGMTHNFPDATRFFRFFHKQNWLTITGKNTEVKLKPGYEIGTIIPSNTTTYLHILNGGSLTTYEDVGFNNINDENAVEEGKPTVLISGEHSTLNVGGNGEGIFILATNTPKSLKTIARIENGGVLNAGRLVFGHLNDTTHNHNNFGAFQEEVQVSGQNSRLKVGTLNMGGLLHTRFLVENGASVNLSETSSFYSGVIDLKGESSSIISTGGVILGQGYNNRNSALTMNVGAGSRFNVGSTLFMGYNLTPVPQYTAEYPQKTELNIAKGGLVTANDVVMATHDEVKPLGDLAVVANVEGELKVNNLLFVGTKGEAAGILNIRNGGQVNTAWAWLAQAGNMKGEITIDGAGSALNVRESVLSGTENSNQGQQAKISVLNGGLLSLKNAIADTPMHISFDNGTLQLNGATENLFTHFDQNTPINIKAGGLTVDTQAFDVSVAQNAVFQGEGDVRKMGSGTLLMSLAGAQWQGKTVVHDGKLKFVGDYTAKAMTIDKGLAEVDGNFSLSASEPLTIGVRSMTDYGKVQASGKILLNNGKVAFDAKEAAALVIKGKLVDVLQATGESAENRIEGKIGETTSNSQLFDFKPEYRHNAVDFMVCAKNSPNCEKEEAPQPQPQPQPQTCESVEGCVRQFNNWAALPAAQMLDEIFQRKPSSELVRTFLPLSSAQAVSEATTQLLPLHLGYTHQALLDHSQTVSSALQMKMYQPTALSGVWAQVHQQHAQRDELSLLKQKSQGVMFGADTAGEQYRLGLAAALYRSTLDSERHNANHQSRVRSWKVLGYGSYHLSPNVFTDVQLGVGQSQLRNSRDLPFGQHQATSRYLATEWQAGTGLNYRLGTAKSNLTPFVRLDYRAVHSPNYQEQGAGELNLHVQKQRTTQLIAQAGLALNKALAAGFSLTGTVSVGQNLVASASPITASLAAEPDYRFNLQSKAPRTFTQASIGVQYQPVANFALEANFQGGWQKGYRQQGGNVSVRYSF